MSGTPAWCASTTAGCSSAAAVPLVTQMMVGLPVAIANPRAKKPALRSSRRTWIRSRSARGRANGVEREPGQIDRIGDPEADPFVHQGGAEGGLYAHPACHSMSTCAVRGRHSSSCTASPRRVASGVASATCWPSRTPCLASTFPDTATRARCGPTCPTTAALVARRGAVPVGDDTVRPARATRWVLAWPCMRCWVRACPCGGVVFIGVTAGIEDPDARARRRRPTTPWPRSWRPRVTSPHFVDSWLQGPMFARLASGDAAQTRRTTPQHRGRPGLQPAPVRDRHTGALVGSPAELCRSRPGPGRIGRHPLRRARTARGPACAARRRSLVPGGGHAVHLAQPEQAARMVRHWLDAVEPGPT